MFNLTSCNVPETGKKKRVNDEMAMMPLNWANGPPVGQTKSPLPRGLSVTLVFKQKTRKTTPRVKGFLKGALCHLSATAAFLERTHPIIRGKRKTTNRLMKLAFGFLFCFVLFFGLK